MPDRTEAENWSLAQADHELAIAFAQFCKAFSPEEAGDVEPSANENAHLSLVLAATIYASCRDLAEWLLVAEEDYRVAPLAQKTGIKKSNPAVAARAIYLREALTRLLTLVGAPEAIVADLGALLEPLCRKGAPKRAKVQKAILENPDAGVRGAARKLKSSPGQISNDRQAGTLATPTDGVWHRPD